MHTWQEAPYVTIYYKHTYVCMHVYIPVLQERHVTTEGGTDLAIAHLEQQREGTLTCHSPLSGSS